MRSRKVLLIGNPVAGYGYSRSKIYTFIRMLEARNHRVDVCFTASPGDARRLASDMGSDVERLVVAGGDGTLNEVINGVKDPSRVPILLFPAGTSNTMARELGLPKKMESIVQILEQGNVRRLDMGILGHKRFLLFVGIGLDAMVTEAIFRKGRYRLGYGRYFIPLMKMLLYYRPPNIKVKVDGYEGGGGMILVSNTRHYGWIFKVADLARCDSGHLDICIFPGKNIISFLDYALAASLRRVSTIKKVNYITGKEIFIDSDSPVPVQVDGDYHGTTPVFITLHPCVVPMLVP